MKKSQFILSSSGRWFSPAVRRPWLILGVISTAGLLVFSALADFSPVHLVFGVILFHFLPGVAVSKLFRRNDPFEDVVFGLALSPLVITLLIYLFGALLRLPLPAAMVISGLLLVTALSIPTGSPGPGKGSAFEWPAAAPLGAGLLLILLTAAHYLHDTSNMLNFHGLFHCTGINQIVAGLIPPDNLHLYGHPSGYQWPAWIAPAVSSILMNASPPLTAAVSRLCTFAGILGLGYLLARDLGQTPAGRAFSGLLTVLGMNLFGGLLYLFRLTASPELLRVVITGSYLPGLPRLLTPEWMALHLRPRTGSIIINLVKFSFIIPGYAAVMVAVLGAIRILRGRVKGGCVLIFFGAATALLVHPILAVILALPLPLALVLTWVVRRQGERLPLSGLIGMVLGLGLAALPALPYLLQGMHTVGRGGVAFRIEAEITLALFWLYLPLLPLAVPATVRAFRERNREGVFLSLLAASIALFVLIQQVMCDWYHLYLMAIPLGLLAGDQLGRWFHRLRSRSWRTALAAALGLLVLLGPLLRMQGFTVSRRADEGRYRFSGVPTLTLRDRDSDRARAYDWVRRQTPLHAVLVERPKNRNFEELSACTGRRVYVGKPTPHTPVFPVGEGNPMYWVLKRVRLLRQPGADKRKALEKLAGLPDPAYLFLSRADQRERFSLLVEEYATLTEYLQLELDLPAVKIYRVRPAG